MPEKKATTHYHVRSKLTHARVVIDVPRDAAESECKRLNREAETGVRAAYNDGRGGVVPEQRLVSKNNGQALTSTLTYPQSRAFFMNDKGIVTDVPAALADSVSVSGEWKRLDVAADPVTDEMLMDPKHVGRILHDGQPMEYEVEVEKRA